MSGFDDEGVKAAVARLLAGGYDSAREQERLADAGRDSAGALTGVSWWRESISRFNRAEGIPDDPPLTPPPGALKH